MKLKNGFVLGEIAGEYVVMPSGDALDLTKITTLNETGKFIWEHLEQETTEEEIVAAILAEYDINREDAAACVAEFIKKLESYNFLET